MSAAAAAADGVSKEAGPAKKGGKKKLILIAVPVLLLAIGAGLWFSGILPGLLGMKKEAPTEHAGEHEKEKEKEKEKEAGHAVPVYVDLPEMVANLNAPGRRPTYVKVKVRVELAKAEDQAIFTAAQPRVVDLFQTYLREMRPEELRGSAGTYRLRGELITRANIAVSPARIVDVLFSELLVQ